MNSPSNRATDTDGRPSLATGDALCGFTVTGVEDLAEIDGTAYTLLHERSGAKLLYLQNDDANKAFSITFKTPPADDTGTFHILEHSVLCGSDKFPVKEPFVNLLKSSMQTFLNAMTFPDKTMYPVASTNEQDLLNLMDVYLDAVLHPAIYSKRAIFEQEGWHYELAEAAGAGAAPGAEDAPDAGAGAGGGDGRDSGGDFGGRGSGGDEPPAARLAYNGVVYNEMKGELSNPDSVLFDALSAALFPDTAYRFESGGTPAAIPSLTYEQFLDNHRRHYRLDNSYLTLYGNLDLRRFLAFLDDAYLAPCAAASAPACASVPNDLALQPPVRAFGIRRAMATAPENACAALGYVVGDVHDRIRVMAADILLDAIMGSNESPLKRALLDAELADDAQAYLVDAVLQPFVVMQLKGLREGGAARFQPVVEDAVRALADGALDLALVEASLSRAEFVMRERSFGVADGVALAMSSLAGWLYDDGLATAYLHYEDAFSFLRAQLETTYFPELLSSLFLGNPHAGGVEVVPVDQDESAGEAARLAEAAAAMDATDFAAIDEDVERLRRAQEEPDSPAALATLPRLSTSDIGAAPEEPPYGLDAGAPVTCLRHDIPTRGIAYAYRYFSLSGLDFDDLPYVSVLAMVLGKLGTDAHDAREIDTLVQGRLGNLSFFAEVHENAEDPHALVPLFVASASALSENAECLAQLPNEIMLTSDFGDVAKIRDVLVQKRVAMEQGFAAAGHSAAMARLSSYYAPAGVVREQLGGVDFYRFLKGLLEAFDERADELVAHLRRISALLFTRESLTVSFTGSDEDYARFWEAGGGMDATAGGDGRTGAPHGRAATEDMRAGGGCGSLATDAGRASDAAGDAGRAGDAAGDAGQARLAVPAPVARNEAFIVPTDVTFAASGYDRRLLGSPYSGTWLVASRALSFDYLWNEVRVKGGAYGTGFQVTRTGAARFYSYRDPHLDETIARFGAAGAWLGSFDPDAAEMEGYVVSTVAGIDAPLKPRELARRQDGQHFSQVASEARLQTRDEALHASAGDVRALGEAVEEAAARGLVCVFGSKDVIDAARTPLAVIDLLGEAKGSDMA